MKFIRFGGENKWINFDLVESIVLIDCEIIIKQSYGNTVTTRVEKHGAPEETHARFEQLLGEINDCK